jgi:hypothetical protein
MILGDKPLIFEVVLSQPLATELSSTVHNVLSVPFKDYEAPPPSHILTLSRGEGGSG